MFLRILLSIFISCLLYTTNVYAIRFCSQNGGDRSYFPLFVLDKHEFYNQNQMQLKCYEVPDSELLGKTYVSLKTNGFNVDYRNNITALRPVLCGAQEACRIPVIYNNKHLDYIHVSVWPKDNSMTGTLSAIYR